MDLFVMGTDNIVSEDLKVLVFRSNIDSKNKVVRARKELLMSNEIYRIDVDLEDYENVLRVECHPDIRPEQVKEKMIHLGFRCSQLK